MITATNYAGRLHVGYGDENSISKCLGHSINSYRNPISIIFSKLFGFSMDIEIDGKNRCLNKESFKKHLQSIGFDGNIEEVRKIGYKEFIQKNNHALIVGNDKLGENFSNKKRIDLFVKMIEELEVNNTQAAKRLIRKGAYIDREFFKHSGGPINGKGPLFWLNRSEIEEHLAYFYREVNFYSYTPLTMAAEKGNQSLAKFILKAKNNDISSDRILTFKLNESPCKLTRWNTKIVKVERVIVNDGNIIIR